MKRVWHFALIAALLATSLPGIAWAQTASPAIKPVAVVAFSGYNELKADIGYIGQLADNPDLALGLEVLLKLSLKNRGLDGLDKARPWGFVVQLDEAKLAQGVKQPNEAMVGYGVLPVSNLKNLLSVLEPVLGAARETEGGILELSKANLPSGAKDAAKTNPALPGGKTLFVKQVDSWALISTDAASLAQASQNVEPLLTDLTKKYDLAIRFDLASVPQEIRAKFLSDMQKNAQLDLERQKASVSEEEYIVRKIAADQIVQIVTNGLDDLTEMTLGWALDNKAKKTYLDVNLTAKPNSKTAERLARLRGTQTSFAGFLLPGATLQANWTGSFGQSSSPDAFTVLNLFRKRAMAEIEKQPQEQAKFAAQLLDGLIDMLKDTMAAGRVDGGMAAKLEPKELTVVAGGFVADGEKIDAQLKKFVDDLSQEHPEVAAVLVWKAGEHKGVKLHAAYIPLPFEMENRDKVVPMVGDVLEVVVATGKQSAYLAFGRNAIAMLKAVIDKSADEASATVPPLRVSVDLGTLTKFAAVMGDKEEDRQKAALAAALLEEAGPEDHVNLSATSLENGLQLHLELEEGILKAIGKAATNQGAQVKSDFGGTPHMSKIGK